MSYTLERTKNEYLNESSSKAELHKKEATRESISAISLDFEMTSAHKIIIKVPEGFTGGYSLDETIKGRPLVAWKAPAIDQYNNNNDVCDVN